MDMTAERREYLKRVAEAVAEATGLQAHKKAEYVEAYIRDMEDLNEKVDAVMEVAEAALAEVFVGIIPEAPGLVEPAVQQQLKIIESGGEAITGVLDKFHNPELRRVAATALRDILGIYAATADVSQAAADEARSEGDEN